MNSAAEVRNFIVEFLRRELIGPSPGYPAVQINRDEILRPQDPPRHRYGAGILFPMKAFTPEQEMIEPVEADSTSDVPEADEILESGGDADREVRGAARTEMPPETDQEINLANVFLPSAMGLSTVVGVRGDLLVDVSAATYSPEELPWIEKKSTTGELSYPNAWWRKAFKAQIRIPMERVLCDDIQAFELAVCNAGAETGLFLHVLTRPLSGAGRADNLRLITFTLINRKQRISTSPKNEECFFQCGLSVAGADGSACFKSYPDNPAGDADPEESSLRLLYRHRKVFAVGHGCSADWLEGGSDGAVTIQTDCLPIFEMKPILPTEIKGLDLSMYALSEGGDIGIEMCTLLADQYEDWIRRNEEYIRGESGLSDPLRIAANRHMSDCRECLRRIRDGISLLKSDEEVSIAFKLMNRAMLMQQIHYQFSSKGVRNWRPGTGRTVEIEKFRIPTYGPETPNRWRPFQLAFILMNLRSLAEPECDDRGVVDLIWFPTGGGKTEAYLGLSAYSLFLRRLKDPANAGTSIVMRYTLRLLTTQQFQRAASLICACEVIRREGRTNLGPASFTIGLWVGGEVTPNSEADANQNLSRLLQGERQNKFVVLSCPWCGAAMGPVVIGRSVKCIGYKRLTGPTRIRFACEDPDCQFANSEGLPLQVIDEHIYAEPPSLLIGTVDKFAMMPWQPKSRTLFGIDTPFSPPDLIIQDELHLISGPLGSMVGHYETVIDILCSRRTGGVSIPPKIIASTATISRAKEQVRAVYDRRAFLFPPQGLRAGDSFFAEERTDQLGRLYVGVLATALPSHVTAQVRVIGSLLQAVKMPERALPEVLDPYWTLMGYFNSLRELGHAATLIKADIREYLNALWDRLGLQIDLDREKPRERWRFINRDLELTSRVPSSEITSILQQLFTQYRGPDASKAVDVCFATNMIQVGLDVPRLSLMTIVGQPKTTSEYIQASSRVGRDRERPGLVVTNYNPAKPRDRSHFEHFRAYHESIYRYVEPTSVTPFAVPVRERALHALIVTLVRFLGSNDLRSSPSPPPDENLEQNIRDLILSRIQSVDPEEVAESAIMIDEIFAKWSSMPPPKYGNFGQISEEMPLMYPAGSQQHPLWAGWPFATPTSMRNVDSDCEARVLVGGYPAVD